MEIKETQSFVQIKIDRASEQFVEWVNQSSDNLSGDIFIEYKTMGFGAKQEYMLGVHKLVAFLKEKGLSISEITITISKLY